MIQQFPPGHQDKRAVKRILKLANGAAIEKVGGLAPGKSAISDSQVEVREDAEPYEWFSFDENGGTTAGGDGRAQNGRGRRMALVTIWREFEGVRSRPSLSVAAKELERDQDWHVPNR